MVRTQIQLTESLAANIKSLAARQHVSMAEMIRRAVASWIESSPDVAGDDRYERASAAAGRFRSGRKDLSSRHDAHFAEAHRP